MVMRHPRGIWLVLSSICLSTAIWCPTRLEAGGRANLASRLTVRLYDNTQTPMPVLERAQQTAAQIFGKAGVRLTWRICRASGGTAALDPCNDLLAPAEVMVRIVTGAPVDKGDRVRLGYSLVTTAEGGGKLSTVFADRVATVADSAAVPVDVVLGRTISHELGHLLLGTTAHPRRGVMRAHWPGALQKSRSPRDWSFSRAEAARFGRTLFAWNGAAPVQAAAAVGQ